MRRWLSNIWYAVDVLINVLLLGERETMSSRMGKKIAHGEPCKVCRVVCRLLDIFWPDHCIHNIQKDR